jgi:hypothetical protein
MPVGMANAFVFACAGALTADSTERSTLLYEVTNPSGLTFVQDLLNGDSKGFRNETGTPVTAILSPIAGPGDPIRNGIVQCAMTQQDDLVATRELHMIAIVNGVLYHSLASNFGPTQSHPTLNRFRTVSGWGDVGAALGGGYGTITSAAVVANPSSISVFFVAKDNGVYHLWHTVRFSADGSWRPVKDVLALSGDAPSGSAFPIFVSAGVCPELGAAVWDQSTTETLIALRGGDPLIFPSPLAVKVIRVVAQPRQWAPGVDGFYSPSRQIPIGPLLGATTATAPMYLLRRVIVSARPFRDDAMP